jgi:hypothetical protein
MTHHTQTKHTTKTIQTIKDTLHTMNTMQIQLQLQQIQLQQVFYKYLSSQMLQIILLWNCTLHIILFK